LSKKVLIVDDDKDFVMGLNVRLKRSGYDTAIAVDGYTAIRVALDQHPDLVLLDLGLPAGDGFVVMKRMREHVSLIAVPVIIVTARDPYMHIDRAREAGVASFFQKPVDNDVLLRAIRKSMDRV
jgi:DNA-binding response OmpR family regulator